MRVIDREPTADTVAIITPLEGSLRPDLFEVPAVSKEALSLIDLRGKNRFENRQELAFPTSITHIEKGRDRIRKSRGSGRSRRHRGCGSCRREVINSSSACPHSGLPGLKLISPFVIDK